MIGSLGGFLLALPSDGLRYRPAYPVFKNKSFKARKLKGLVGWLRSVVTVFSTSTRTRPPN